VLSDDVVVQLVSGVGVEKVGVRILLCEDHKQVREIVSESLAAAGFDVVAAARPMEAIELAETVGPFAVLVSDVVMPEMDGAQLADRLRSTHPDLRVLFVSGYAGDVIGDSELDGPDTAFLAKPFSPTELISAIRELTE
jgi:two-component system cell cycle sensor histidine kinase/response regulator CckA